MKYQFDSKQLGRNIQHNRKKLFPKQSDLADRLKVSTKTISNWELGLINPSISKLILLHYLFCCSMDDLLKNTHYFEGE